MTEMNLPHHQSAPENIRSARIQNPILPAFMLVTSLFPLFIGPDATKAYGPLILLIHFLIGITLISSPRNLSTIFSPNAIVFLYTSISLILGSFALKESLTLVERNILEYIGHIYTHVAISFIMVGLTIIVSIQYFSPIETPKNERFANLTTGPFIISIILIAPAAILGLDLSYVGGSGNIASYAQSVMALIVILFIQKYKMPTRYVLFLITIFVISILNPHDKRIAIFLALPFLLLEVRRGSLTFALYQVFPLIIIIFSLIYAILVMSILRGYGGYDVAENIFSAFTLVPEYVTSENFAASFFQNIEVSYFYFHYVNAIEYTMSGYVDLSLGETLLKFVTLPIPREFMDSKPNSMITLYTQAHSYSFRHIGGSWPPNFAAEYFWNFHFFGILLFFPLAYLNLKLHRFLFSSRFRNRPFFGAFILLIYMQILTYARGSGIDLFLFEITVSGLLLLVPATVTHLFDRKTPNSHFVVNSARGR